MTDYLMQERAGTLVSREVYCHVGGLIDEITERAPEWIANEFYALYRPTDEQVREEMEYADCDEDTARDNLMRELEIYEFWAVSDWLGDKLKERGEIVAEIGLTTVWGRQCSGQAIKLDGVIQEIVTATDYASWLKDEAAK